MNERENLMKQIMAYCFAAHEWNLYLDTHPDDKIGLYLFGQMRDKAEELKSQYAREYGPITVSDVNSTENWTWLDEPWPWN